MSTDDDAKPDCFANCPGDEFCISRVGATANIARSDPGKNRVIDFPAEFAYVAIDFL